VSVAVSVWGAVSGVLVPVQASRLRRYICGG
jgi:hypothetical protein